MGWWRREVAWLSRSVMAVVFVVIGVEFSPEKLNIDGQKVWMYVKLCHLLSNSIAWGASLWVTFIANIIMFKNLPRHEFGNLQSKMFPTFFLTLGICCATSVVAFGYLHPWNSASTSESYQLGFLISAFALTLANLFVLTPFTTKLMKQKYKMEKEINIGDEVGWSKNIVEAPKMNPKLAAMSKKFGIIHGLSYVANMLPFACLTMHSCYLATKINI